MVPLSASDKDRHEQIGDDGLVYKRVYSMPHAAHDSRMKTFSKDEFRSMTTDKKGLKVGDMWEISAEMAEKRAAKEGKDPVTEQFYRDFEQKNGVKHMSEIKSEKKKRLKDVADKLGFAIEE